MKIRRVLAVAFGVLGFLVGVALMLGAISLLYLGVSAVTTDLLRRVLGTLRRRSFIGSSTMRQWSGDKLSCAALAAFLS